MYQWICISKDMQSYLITNGLGGRQVLMSPNYNLNIINAGTTTGFVTRSAVSFLELFLVDFFIG
jgi:hypothetical protein